MTYRPPRVAVRGVILQNNRLLLVNAWPGGESDLWCAPGGGVEPGTSLPDTLRREVHEETGLTVEVGQPCLVNEFHDRETGYHQIEVFFRCTIRNGAINDDWRDPEGVVNRRRFFTRTELKDHRFKPDSLPRAAWDGEMLYDPLETLQR